MHLNFPTFSHRCYESYRIPQASTILDASSNFQNLSSLLLNTCNARYEGRYRSGHCAKQSQPVDISVRALKRTIAAFPQRSRRFVTARRRCRCFSFISSTASRRITKRYLLCKSSSILRREKPQASSVSSTAIVTGSRSAGRDTKMGTRAPSSCRSHFCHRTSAAEVSAEDFPEPATPCTSAVAGPACVSSCFSHFWSSILSPTGSPFLTFWTCSAISQRR